MDSFIFLFIFLADLFLLKLNYFLWLFIFFMNSDAFLYISDSSISVIIRWRFWIDFFCYWHCLSSLSILLSSVINKRFWCANNFYLSLLDSLNSRECDKFWLALTDYAFFLVMCPALSLFLFLIETKWGFSLYCSDT